jgi:hypothetical protein
MARRRRRRRRRRRDLDERLGAAERRRAREHAARGDRGDGLLGGRELA